MNALARASFISFMIVHVYNRKLELSRLTLLTDWNGTIETVKG